MLSTCKNAGKSSLMTSRTKENSVAFENIVDGGKPHGAVYSDAITFHLITVAEYPRLPALDRKNASALVPKSST